MFGDPFVNPKGWEVKELKELILLANNGLSRRGNNADGNIVLRLVELQDGYIDYTSVNRIKLTEAEEKRYLLQSGDFLFARVNGNPDNVGRCAYYEDIGENVYHNDHIIRVRLDNSIVNNCFVSTMLNSPYGKLQMKDKLKTSAGQYTVNQTGISEIKIVVPPINIQIKFEDFVKQVDKLKFEIEKS
ncbi:restriction endonuclease subunit S [Clostridium paraputrificum]|uniref:restriction endonuclease subunit S n=1 Tax=Clostridium paraputrificum TaxID=29363 RepID=UPI00232C0105|nr:restriction endonuclease subunit S [Clostridium paraputrificum]MDB2105603.1 restriction endonuclease subunit S [Clostridium paraputrificum]MDB2112156.1 restriction endonuclease subunit S [Clostridium paraputrificum]